MKIKQVFILFFSALLSVFLIELVLRLVNFPYLSCERIIEPEETHFGQFDPQTGWSWKSKTEHQGQYNYFFNEDGIRVPSPGYQFDLDKPTIMFIGGSVTFGYAVNYEDTFPSQIKSLLDDRFEVINLGVQAFGTDQSYLLMKRFIEKYSPELIVYTFIQGHVERNITYDRRVHFDCHRFLGSKPVFDFNNNEDLFLRRTPVKTRKMDRFKTRLLVDWVGQLLRQRKMSKQGKDLELTRALIKKIHEESQEKKIIDLYIFYDNHVNQKLIKEELFDKQNLDFLPFYEYFKNKDKNNRDFYIDYDQTDNFHPSRELNREIAKKFIEKYQKELSIFVDDN